MTLPLLAAAIAVIAGTVSQPAQAQSKMKSTMDSTAPQIKFEDYTLKNGLRVLLSPDHSAPVIAVSVTYNVGSRNERPGRTGFAHLFEHMMFQGSENIGRGEHMMLINDNGGTFNGSTNQDRTNYFEALPANQLDVALFVEADRMRSLDISQSNLDNQRAVVKEEKRQSYDNRAYGGTYEKLLDLAYTNFAYKHTTIGSMEDLSAANIEDVRSFFKTYYAPNNAALAVVGDFDVKTAKAKIEKYFGGIASQPTPPAVDITESAPSGERRATLNDKLAKLPQIVYAYPTVPGNQPDANALDVLASILGDGRTSRLYKPLVESRLALNARASLSSGRGPSLFQVSASLPQKGNIDTVEGIVNTEIERIQKEGVTEEELKRAKAQFRVADIASRATALNRANTLSLLAVYYNDPNYINTELPHILAVTAADVQRVAQKYLMKENRAVVITLPATAPASGGAN